MESKEIKFFLFVYLLVGFLLTCFSSGLYLYFYNVNISVLAKFFVASYLLSFVITFVVAFLKK